MSVDGNSQGPNLTTLTPSEPGGKMGEANEQPEAQLNKGAQSTFGSGRRLETHLNKSTEHFRRHPGAQLNKGAKPRSQAHNPNSFRAGL